ncbi:hypothetical protein FRC03_004608 [Tulasnella sp. 419]|nr:hypothetical protein FRC03_004608 [Tulasnella sp. 419]
MTERAVDSVVWLLEHSEHVDTTIAALDACRRLPTKLLVPAIDRREGLRQRLLDFHRDLILLSVEQGAERNESLQDRAAISDVALFHLFKLDQDTLLISIRRPLKFKRLFRKIPYALNVSVLVPRPDERADFVVFELANANYITTVWSTFGLTTRKSSLRPLQFQINLSDAREPSVTNRLVSSVIPTDLWAEAITCDAIHDFGRYPISPTELQELPWIQIIETLDSILDAEPSGSTISYVAISIAAIHWRICSAVGQGRWGYASQEEQEAFVQSLKSSVYSVDKRKAVLDNVTLALSPLDISCPDQLSRLYHTLLSRNFLRTYDYTALDQPFFEGLADYREETLILTRDRS